MEEPRGPREDGRGGRARRATGAHGALDRHRYGCGGCPSARPGALAICGPGARAPLRRGRGPDAKASRRAIEITLVTLHRLLGVGIGEHLGYLLTGLWTLLAAASILSSAVLPGWLGIIGLPIGIALLIGTPEFVGPNEEHGWPLAGTIVPIAYVAWSLWLIAMGMLLLL
jgi:hypothetical protein